MPMPVYCVPVLPHTLVTLHSEATPGSGRPQGTPFRVIMVSLSACYKIGPTVLSQHLRGPESRHFNHGWYLHCFCCRHHQRGAVYTRIQANVVLIHSYTFWFHVTALILVHSSQNCLNAHTQTLESKHLPYEPTIPLLGLYRCRK